MSHSYSYEDTFPAGPQAAEPGSWRDAGAGTSLGGTTLTKGDPDVLTRVVQGAHHTVDRLAETAAPQVQRMQDGLASALELGGELRESLRGTVRENPLLALGAALAAGLVIGRISR